METNGRNGMRHDLGQITSEREILATHLKNNIPLKTEIQKVKSVRKIKLAAGRQNELGIFRSPESRKAVIADVPFLDNWRQSGLKTPSFLEAGPRAALSFNPQKVHAAIVTTGGLAPGLHCVIHSIVKRHCHAYQMNVADGKIYGIYNSFKGTCQLADNLFQLDSKTTEDWLDHGGSELGIVRYKPKNDEGEEMEGDRAITKIANDTTVNLEENDIDILYVIGGDGSMRVAHEIAVDPRNEKRSIIGIPKTMDNDILWVWQSFGFDTAVEQATRVINTLRSEAEATRRIGLIQLFGAESGYVAANAALASGHVDAVLIPEVIKGLDKTQAEYYLHNIIQHVQSKIRENRRHNPHALIVVSEGVGTYLQELKACIQEIEVTKSNLIKQLHNFIYNCLSDAHGEKVAVFENEPRHYIRSLPANAHDQIYCERLGALAVDNALAGYTDCMVSQWLTEFVLVPMEMVIEGRKSIPVNGMFWKQVVSTTGQPLSPAEKVSL